ncbi:MAG: FAD-dependent oxidoreductase, partial [Caldimonas sp.]
MAVVEGGGIAEGSRRVIVLGAGLSGASVALELAAQGVAVTLIERDPQP